MAGPHDDIAAVLARFPQDCQPRGVEYLDAAGGFSGARFWRLNTPRGRLCLRRWPVEHPDRSRLAFIHSVLRHVGSSGFTEIAAPIPTDSPDQATFVFSAGHYWELTPWLTGTADYHAKPSPNRLKTALRALARFHLAAASFGELSGRNGPAPAIQNRQNTARRWLAGDLDRLAGAMSDREAVEWPELFRVGSRIVQQFRSVGPTIADQMAEVADLPVPIQPCIRDIWEQHVLFEGENVSGIVDFGAMRPDTVATDIARLVGSLAEDCRNDWDSAVQAYCDVRPLADNEHQLVAVLDRSSVALAGLNWLRWIYLDRRSFAQKEVIEARLKTILRRLSQLP